MSKPSWGRYLWQLVVAIIPVLITIWLTVLYIQDQGEVQYIEYKESIREEFVNLPDLLPSKLQLTYDGNPVGNLSSIRYQIFNRTGESFQDVKFYFQIKLIDGSPIQLLSKDIKGPDGYPKDGFKELTPKVSSIGWSIATMNTSESLLNTFEVSLIFLGSKAPQVEIAILKTGLSLKPFTVLTTSGLFDVLKIIIVVIVVLLYLTLLFWLRRLSRSKRNRFLDELRSEFIAYFEINKYNLPRRDPNVTANEIYEIYKKMSAIQNKDPIVSVFFKLMKVLKNFWKE